MSKPFVSVVIPVYNDTERLKLCLEALEAQTYPSDRYEVIVVDNNSDSPLVADELKEFEHVILEFEDERGPGPARNKGLLVAKGEIVAFTDSDCIPYPDWIEKGVSNLIDNSFNASIGGRIEVFPRDPQNPTAVELWDCLFAFRQKQYVEVGGFSVTANFFVPRKIWDIVGPFNSKLFACEDQEWCRRAASHGFRVLYGEDVVIKHPARRTLEDFRKREIKIVDGTYHLEKIRGYSFVLHMASLVSDCIPSWDKLSRILWSEEVEGVFNKVKVIGITFYVNYLWVSERIKLMLKEFSA